MEARAVLCALLLLLYSLHYLRQLPSVLPGWWHLAKIFSLRDAVVTYLRGLGEQRRSDSEMEICIAESIAQKKLQWTRWMVSIILPVLSAVMLVCVLLHQPVEKRVVAAGRMYAIAAIHFLMLLTKVFPDWLNSRNVDRWHSMVMCCLIIGTSPLAVEKRSNYTSFYALLLLSCSFANLKPLACIFWSSIYTFVKCFTFSFYVYEDQSTCGHMQMKTRDYFIEQVVVCGMTVLLTICFTRLLESDVRHHVVAETERTQSSALSSLLGLLCEVVVELDTDLAFADEVPGFESWLLLRNRAGSLSGVKIETFIPDEADRQNLRSHIEQKGCNSVASLFHITLQDALTNRVRTEFFHVPFRSCSDKVHHLIGIREHSDDPQSNKARDQCAGFDTDVQVIPKTGTASSKFSGKEVPWVSLAKFRDTSGASVLSRVRHGEGSSSSGLSSESSDAGLGAQSNLQVDFLLNDRYPVMAISPHFKKAFGSSSVGTSLKEYIPESPDFYEKLQRRRTEILQGGPCPVIEIFSQCCIRSRRRRGPASTKSTRVQVLFPRPQAARDPKGCDFADGEAYRVSLQVLAPSRTDGPTDNSSEIMAPRESQPKVSPRLS